MNIENTAVAAVATDPESETRLAASSLSSNEGAATSHEASEIPASEGSSARPGPSAAWRSEVMAKAESFNRAKMVKECNALRDNLNHLAHMISTGAQEGVEEFLLAAIGNAYMLVGDIDELSDTSERTPRVKGSSHASRDLRSARILEAAETTTDQLSEELTKIHVRIREAQGVLRKTGRFPEFAEQFVDDAITSVQRLVDAVARMRAPMDIEKKEEATTGVTEAFVDDMSADASWLHVALMQISGLLPHDDSQSTHFLNPIARRALESVVKVEEQIAYLRMTPAEPAVRLVRTEQPLLAEQGASAQ